MLLDVPRDPIDGCLHPWNTLEALRVLYIPLDFSRKVQSILDSARSFQKLLESSSTVINVDGILQKLLESSRSLQILPKSCQQPLESFRALQKPLKALGSSRELSRTSRVFQSSLETIDASIDLAIFRFIGAVHPCIHPSSIHPFIKPSRQHSFIINPPIH